MKTLPCKRKKSKPSRRIGIVEAIGIWFLLEIVSGRRTDYYLTRQIVADFGLGFELEKEDGTIYHANLNGVNGHHVCDCQGFNRHHRCKHTDGLQALVQLGRLKIRPMPATSGLKFGRDFRHFDAPPAYDPADWAPHFASQDRCVA